MAAQPTYAPPPPPAPPASPLPAWLRFLGIGCGALLLLGMVAGSLFVLVLGKATEGPEATIKAFLTAAGSGDYGTARGRAVFVLPGSPKAAELGLTRLILPVAGHLVGQLRRAR